MTSLQRVLLGIFKAPPRRHPPKLAGARILAVQIAGMGDLTLAVPALRALRQANPAGQLDLLTSSKGSRAAEGCPHIGRIESLDIRHLPASGAKTGEGVVRLLSLIRRVRRRRYDIAVNLMGLYSPRGAVRMGLLLSSLGIPFLAGRDTSGTGTFYHLALKDDPTVPRNERDIHLELVRLLGASEDSGEELEAWPSAEDDRHAAEAAAALPGEGPIVGVNPGTDRAEKNWPEERYLEVMRVLRQQRGARFLLTGGPADAALTARLAAVLGPETRDTAGRTSYQGTVSLIRKCDLFLTSDTAALHLAWAAGAQAVALFRRENLGRYRPATDRITCLTGDEEENRLDLSAKDVLKACLERLDSRGTA